MKKRRLMNPDQQRQRRGVKHVFAPPEEVAPPAEFRCGLTFIGMELTPGEIDAVMTELMPARA